MNAFNILNLYFIFLALFVFPDYQFHHGSYALSCVPKKHKSCFLRVHCSPFARLALHL